MAEQPPLEEAEATPFKRNQRQRVNGPSPDQTAAEDALKTVWFTCTDSDACPVALARLPSRRLFELQAAVVDELENRHWLMVAKMLEQLARDQRAVDHAVLGLLDK